MKTRAQNATVYTSDTHAHTEIPQLNDNQRSDK